MRCQSELPCKDAQNGVQYYEDSLGSPCPKGKKLTLRCVLRGLVAAFEQIRAPLTGSGQGLFLLPLVNGGVVSAEEHVGDFPAVVFGGPRVDRGGKKAVLEAVAEGARLVANHARHEANQRVGEDGGREFAAAEDVIANADFEGDDMVAQALVDAFVVAADHQQVAGERQLIHTALLELLAVGGEEDDLVVGTLSLQGGDGVVEGLHGEHHACRRAKGRVVHFFVLVGAPLPQVVHVHLDQTFFDASFHDAL